MVGGRISRLSVRDVRFPTSLGGHGSDAMVSADSRVPSDWSFSCLSPVVLSTLSDVMVRFQIAHVCVVWVGTFSLQHTDPDYSVAYVVLETDAEDGLRGHGITFTLGKGTEVVVCAVNALAHHVLNKDLEDIVGDFRGFYRQLTSDGQLRWIGPEKGVVHLATAAILNAVWDLWAKQEGKPLWKLLVDMDARTLLSCIDFRYITDVLTEEEAYEILQRGQVGKKEREEQMLTHGYPAYTTSCAWLGYSDDTLKQLCTEALEGGWTRFKVKVGADLQDDIRRCQLIRNMIGPEKTLMMDANQRWDVPEAVEWMAKLAEFKPLWIEEPTSPDDILGHATISKCHNRVMFKQLLQAKALQFLQIDSCRLGSVNENLSVLLMAKKFEIPVCPHAGGVGLCELVQHLILFDFISVSASLTNRMCEYVDHLHEHFTYPVTIKNASYMPPKEAGYSTEMKEESVKKHQYPDGEIWKKLLTAQGN
ncbi:mitochondrial enolase superfamily member 1 isoform X2 [Eptesicus fuscus]|uniref:mitochondrial enolase superfamily member 1 isoform X2 n=1 Tax=Eptesicus fuscus TaxID=29078 RepID=UPI002403FB92|nr:mitochondrial enolase superfamily member 1 isoform X2 [Eptesicus fuscus]